MSQNDSLPVKWTCVQSETLDFRDSPSGGEEKSRPRGSVEVSSFTSVQIAIGLFSCLASWRDFRRS